MNRGRRPANKNKSLEGDERPDCPDCGGFLKSDGKKDWKCTACGSYHRKEKRKKVKKRKLPFSQIAGFDTARAEKHAVKCGKRKRLIVTSAQNNTDPEIEFLQSLETAAAVYNCELAVIPVHYKNVTLYGSRDEYKKHWHPLLEPYLVKGDIDFNGHVIRSDVRINSTMVNPLAGRQVHGEDRAHVFGHPQLRMEPIATPADEYPKRVMTTGSATIRNYSQSSDGEKALAHHCNSALLLERRDGDVWVRQLTADETGGFYDLDKYFEPDGYSEGHNILSIATGDEHVKHNTVADVTYLKKNSIVKTLMPEYIVRNDVLDGFAGCHHHDKDHLLQFKKFHFGDNDYEQEMKEVVAFIDKTTPPGATNVIVPSNHHDHLLKWLMSADANKDHTNALFILEMNKIMREAVLEGKESDPFVIYLRDRLTCDFEFAERNESFIIGGVDFSQHFDKGPNGSRGSAAAFAKTSRKVTGAHSHTARIHMGAWQVGKSTAIMGYEKGYSTHSNTHIIQYQNGRRCMIDIYNGRWRA